MTQESEPKREAQLILPEDAERTEKELYIKYNDETLSMEEAMAARPPKASESIAKFYHDLINVMMIRYVGYQEVLDAMIQSTDEHELSFINAYDLGSPEITIFQAWKHGRLQEVRFPDAHEMSEKLETASTPRVKTSLKHFYGWMRNKLAIELGQEELKEMRRKKLEENK